MDVLRVLIFYTATLSSWTNAQSISQCNSSVDSIRLYNRITDVEGEGAVQVCHNGTWYAVCDYSWGCADANVVCRELGYSAGASKQSCY